MRTIICGGRRHHLTPEDMAWLVTVARKLPITCVISGGASGVDTGGEIFARTHSIPLIVKNADWKKWGGAAGPIRNAEMAEIAEAVIAFPGGTGTADMIRKARDRGLKVIVREFT